MGQDCFQTCRAWLDWYESDARHLSGEIRLQRTDDPLTEARKADGAKETKLLIPRPPEATGKLVCTHFEHMATDSKGQSSTDTGRWVERKHDEASTGHHVHVNRIIIHPRSSNWISRHDGSVYTLNGVSNWGTQEGCLWIYTHY